MVSNLSGSYEQKLEALGLSTLEESRKCGDMFEMYKILIPRIMKTENKENVDVEAQKEKETIEKIKELYPNEKKCTQRIKAKNETGHKSKRKRMYLVKVIEEVEDNQEKGIGHPLGHSTTSQGGVALPPGENIIDSSRASHPLDPPSTLQSRLVSHSNSYKPNMKGQSSTLQSGLAFSTKVSVPESINSTSTVPEKNESEKCQNALFDMTS